MRRLLRSWLWRVPIDREVDEEIAFHIEMRTRELIDRGVDPKAAREMVLTRLGDVRRLKRTCVDLGRKRPPVCIVNEAFARRFLRGRNPIGQRVSIRPMTLAPAPEIVREIVGVARQVKAQPDEPEDLIQVYVPMAQNTWMGASLVARPREGAAETLAPAIRRAIARVDKELPVTRILTLDDVARQATARPRFRALLVIAFAVLALTLATVGVFGVLAYSVQQRTREFGVRIALGATMADVVRLVVTGAAHYTAIGVAIGLALAAVASRSIATLLFGVAPWDPPTFGAVGIALAVTAGDSGSEGRSG